jgi:flagellar hook-associated protein 2
MVNDTLQSGGIHFTGLGSGTDFDAITEKLLQVEGIKKQRLELWRSSWATKMEAFDALSTKMTELKSALQKLDTPGEFVTKNVSSTDSNRLTAKADADAVEGTHRFYILALAQNEVEINSTAFNGTDDQVSTNGGQFVYTYGDDTVSVDVTSNTTLEGLVNLINRDLDNPGVRAEAIMVSNGSFRFKLVGMDQGEAYDLTIDGSTTLSNFGGASFTETLTAQDSEIWVDGMTMKRESNFITDAIPGLDITLKEIGLDPVNLTITPDKEGIKENIKTFVEKVNEVRSALEEFTKVDDTKSKNKGSLLTGNYGLQMIEHKVKNATADIAKGFKRYDEDTGLGEIYTALSQLGILTDADEGSKTNGLLVIDDEELDKVLDNDLDAVADLMSAYYEGTSDSDKFVYSSHINGTTQAGTYSVEFSISGGVMQSGATIGGYPASYDSNTQELTSLEGPAQGLAVKITDLSDTTDYEGDVRLKLGKVGEMTELMEELTNENDGTLEVLNDNYQDIIDNIDKKILSETRRLAQKENMLKLKWARLETTLSRYNGIMTQLQSQVSQLTSSS